MTVFEMSAILSGALVGVCIMIWCFSNWLKPPKGFPQASNRGIRGERLLIPRQGNGKPKAPPRPGTYPRPKKIKDEFLEVYSMVGCPSCGQPHRYGLDRDYLDCYACDRTFSPRFDGRKYESYKKGATK